jgi:hypothetical protein
MSQKPHATVHCPACGKTMRLASIIPGIGALPELWTFECRDCREAITEVKDTLLSEADEKLLETAA